MQVLLSVLQERRERRALDVEEAAVAAAATAAAQSSQHNSAKGQWDFAQRVQRAVQSEEEASLASARPARRAQHQRHGSGSDKEGPSHTHRRPAEVMVLMLATNMSQTGALAAVLPVVTTEVSCFTRCDCNRPCCVLSHAKPRP